MKTENRIWNRPKTRGCELGWYERWPELDCYNETHGGSGPDWRGKLEKHGLEEWSYAPIDDPHNWDPLVMCHRRGPVRTLAGYNIVFSGNPGHFIWDGIVTPPPDILLFEPTEDWHQMAYNWFKAFGTGTQA